LSSQDSRPGAVNSLRDRRVARVIDREIAPIWHDRFARLIIRNLPNSSDVIALDIHCGVGRTTAELLHRLGATARVLAIEPDDTLIELARTRMRPEWKNRVYLKVGDFDDITAMADDSYNLVVANLVLGETGDLGSALTEMIRVNRIGGRILATVPVAGSWNEVEDIFSEVLRDAGLHDAVRRLERLRDLRPTGPKLAETVRKLGVAEDDFVIEQERFQMLFPSGREFLFAPVVEHGPLRLWKAVIGKDGSPQELFWRLKEAIDTYYTGHVLAVNVLAGLININVAKGTESPGPRLAARFWRHYPGLDALWGGLAAGYVRVSEPSLPPFGDAEFDFDLEIDEGEARRTGAQKAVTTALPIAMDDLADEPDAPSDVQSAPTPKYAPLRKEPAPRLAGKPAAKPAAKPAVQPAAQPAVQPAAKPVLAEDDFSDINEPIPQRTNYRSADLRNAFGPQPGDASAEPDPPALRATRDEVEEPSDPTSQFRPSELRAAITRRTNDATVDDDDAAAPATDKPDEQALSDAQQATAGRPAAQPLDKPDTAARYDAQNTVATEQTAASDTAASDTAASVTAASVTAASDTAASDTAASVTAASVTAASDTAEPVATDTTASAATAEPVATEPPTADGSAVTDEPDTTATVNATGQAEPVEPTEPVMPTRSLGRAPLAPLRPTPDSGAFRRPVAGENPTFRPPPDSGSFPRPTPTNPNTSPSPSRLVDSGVFRAPTAASPQGTFQPPEPGTQRPSEDSGVRRGATTPAEPVATGSFKVFAPPRPRLSPETDPSDTPAPEAEVAEPPRRSLSDRLGSLLNDLDSADARRGGTSSADAPDAPDAPDEADEDIEPMDELEDDEEQPKASTTKPPPPPRPPPPPSLQFKPRPLLPIVPPKPKK
jgi:ubiquinone/menaquinone biosynthesis C-methylase UbiE